jgi:uracil-DNA glycosylase family 4
MWTERQAAMLKAMGLRLWSPPLPADAHMPATATAVAAAEPAAPAVVAAPPAGILAPKPPTVTRAAAAVPLAALPASVAGLDWPALREAVAQCRACGLCEGRRQTVFGTGHHQAHWLVVGEAPGEQEDATGEPFVGAAGQLLDAMLRALQLSRSAEGSLEERPASQRVYIANTLKCRPPRNRNPEPAEMAQCEPFLQRQIELLQPRLILALGRFAVQSLLRSSEPIGKLRGQVHRYRGLPLIVSYHPAYLLRNPADKARAWDDLCLAASVAEGAQSATAA